MVTSINTGTGIQSINLNLSLIDIFNLVSLNEKIGEVKDNHQSIAEYDTLPYDKRTDENGKKIERPKRIELTDEELTKINAFLNNICRVYGNVPSSNVFDVHPDMANIIDDVAFEL